jgi:hypothetical protein
VRSKTMEEHRKTTFPPCGYAADKWWICCG